MAKHICKKDWRFKHRYAWFNYVDQVWDYWYLAQHHGKYWERGKIVYKKKSRKRLRKLTPDIAYNGNVYKRACFDIAWSID